MGMVPDLSTIDPDDMVWVPDEVLHPAKQPSVTYEHPGQQKLGDARARQQEIDAEIVQLIDRLVADYMTAMYGGKWRDIGQKKRDELYTKVRDNLVPKIMNGLKEGKDITEIDIGDVPTGLYQDFVKSVKTLTDERATIQQDIELLETDPRNEPTVQRPLQDVVRDIALGPPMEAPQMDAVDPYVYEQEFYGAEAPPVTLAGARMMGPAQMQAAQTMGAQIDTGMIDPWLEAEQAGQMQQMEALGLMRGAALGQAPSAAEIQMQMGIDEAIQAQQAAANAARGGAGAQMRAQRLAAQQGAAMQQQGIRQAAMLRAQEMAQARQGFLAGAGQARTQDQFMADLAQARALAQAGFTQEALQLNARLQQEANATNATFLQQAAANNQQAINEVAIFNAQQQNTMGAMEAGFAQEAGMFGEGARVETGMAAQDLDYRTKIANLDAELKTRGLDTNARVQMIASILGVDAEQIRADLGLAGIGADVYRTEQQIESQERMQERDIEAREPEWYEVLGDMFETFAPPVEAVGTLFSSGATSGEKKE